MTTGEKSSKGIANTLSFDWAILNLEWIDPETLDTRAVRDFVAMYNYAVENNLLSKAEADDVADRFINSKGRGYAIAAGNRLIFLLMRNHVNCVSIGIYDKLWFNTEQYKREFTEDFSRGEEYLAERAASEMKFLDDFEGYLSGNITAQAYGDLQMKNKERVKILRDKFPLK